MAGALRFFIRSERQVMTGDVQEPCQGTEIQCCFLGRSFRLKQYGPMSVRQYSVAREDLFMERVVQAGWRRLAYFGASYGLQAIALSSFGPVYAFEPVPCIFEALCENIRLNPGSDIVPLRLGLHSRGEFREIIHGGHNGPTPSLTVLPAGARFRDIAQFVSFSSDLLRLFDAFVIDIEGHEGEVILSGPPVPANVCHVFLELHPDIMGQPEARSVVRCLGDQGFEDTLVSSRNAQEHHWFRRRRTGGAGSP